MTISKSTSTTMTFFCMDGILRFFYVKKRKMKNVGKKRKKLKTCKLTCNRKKREIILRKIKYFTFTFFLLYRKRKNSENRKREHNRKKRKIIL